LLLILALETHSVAGFAMEAFRKKWEKFVLELLGNDRATIFVRRASGRWLAGWPEGQPA